MAAKNMYDIIDATRKGEAYDPSHVRDWSSMSTRETLSTRVDSQAKQVLESVKRQFIGA
jgi:hypothetical protein